MNEKNQESLEKLVRDRRMEARLHVAMLIRDYPAGPVRTEAAELYIRETMYDFTVGAISAEERRRILAILSFAIPLGDLTLQPE